MKWWDDEDVACLVGGLILGLLLLFILSTGGVL